MRLIRVFCSTNAVIAVMLALLMGCLAKQPANGGKKALVGFAPISTSTRPYSGDTMTNEEDVVQTAVELRHFIDPFDGTYKTKLTIPKNYKGNLYLAGLNISSLRDKLVKVRFQFGRELEPVTVTATIGRAPGLTAETDVQVLIMDFSQSPFKDLRLPYDLFDYNLYSDDDDEIVVDPRNGGLYCRGLRLDDDPTFQGSSSKPRCDTAGDRCLYAYAKILDAGLYENGISTIPSEPQIDFSGLGYNNDTPENMLKKCLPNNGGLRYICDISDNCKLSADSGDVTSPGTATDYTDGTMVLSIGTRTFTYEGPYRVVGKSNWEISEGAAVGPNGPGKQPTTLFYTSTPTTSVEHGVLSFLFPIAGRLELDKDIQYLGSDTAPIIFQPRTLHTLLSAGDTRHMDGCNLRVTHYDAWANEGIGSCNITAKIEVFTIEDGKEKILASTHKVDGTTMKVSNVKLQLLRASLTDYQGNEVLYTAMKSCNSSLSCGVSECCFNNRCWGKELVGQCLEDSSYQGNLRVGASCVSDYECASFCCNPSNGRCAVHTTNSEPAVLCSKPPGGTCVTKEYCMQETVTTCLIVKTGQDTFGNVTCTLRCYAKQVNGDCREGICVSPVSPAIPSFDPSNPDCTTAVDPP
jgi:hypothetical protein